MYSIQVGLFINTPNAVSLLHNSGNQSILALNNHIMGLFSYFVENDIANIRTRNFANAGGYYIQYQ